MSSSWRKYVKTIIQGSMSRIELCGLKWIGKTKMLAKIVIGKGYKGRPSNIYFKDSIKISQCKLSLTEVTL